MRGSKPARPSSAEAGSAAPDSKLFACQEPSVKADVPAVAPQFVVANLGQSAPGAPEVAGGFGVVLADLRFQVGEAVAAGQVRHGGPPGQTGG